MEGSDLGFHKVFHCLKYVDNSMGKCWTLEKAVVPQCTVARERMLGSLHSHKFNLAGQLIDEDLALYSLGGGMSYRRSDMTRCCTLVNLPRLWHEHSKTKFNGWSGWVHGRMPSCSAWASLQSSRNLHDRNVLLYYLLCRYLRVKMRTCSIAIAF